MNQKSITVTRRHYFYVAIAKFLFLHPEYGVISTQDPLKIKDAGQYGLTPLILYGVTVAGLPIRWMTFTSVEQPRAFRDVLMEAWCRAEGLRGRPDTLHINRHLGLACPDLLQDMAKVGVQVEIADAKEKSLPASLRSAQGFSQWLPGWYGRKGRSSTDTLSTLCQDAQYDHDFHVKNGHRGAHGHEIEERVRNWLALPMQEPTLTQNCGLDWKPGPWLNSWESSLPPNPSRYFDHDGLHDRIWLRTGDKTPHDTADDDVFFADSCYDNAAAIAKSLVECWPNSPTDIAKSAGFTLRELQWFIMGKAPLERQHRFSLENVLGIQYDERVGEYVGAGPYALMAQKPKALEEFYLAISHGGDAHPCEIIPSQGIADPSWRYVFINTYGEPPSIVMAPRGEKITERLPDLLLNYAGTALVSPEFYRDVVSTCARACREPIANIREMEAFAKRYEEHWINCAWLTE